jgi:serine/threonine protein kinase/WD40 repeat protein
MPETPNIDESIFTAAAALPPDRRAAYLDEVCGADAELRERVESLLRSHEEAGSFLGRPALTTDFVPLTESAGTVIDRYKLLQQIGEGGFGVVFMAEQKEPVRRRVALKIIKPGMDTKEVVARFEAERQALALMEHPNIAKVFDAGATESGRPYFVMELVKGVLLVEFCDKNQLPARERLAIFTAVCQAVQHAHQKGVIHRDLKPSNVLVTLHDGKPVPKVIDFGVAKALNQELTEKTLFTAYGHMVGTPQYMSPEQAEMSGLDVDTRSDVYSLGVLLYELLTGTTPLEAKRLRNAGYAEMQRLIREEEAPRPSLRVSTLGERLSVVAKDRQCDPQDLQRLLRGELDWIVMKALDKDRGRRYETATGLARDVERYLTGDAVEACPPSAGYRLRKFARKHRNGLAVAASFALLLIAAAVVSGWQAVRATLAEGVATQKSKALLGAEAQVRAERDDARGARDELRRRLYVTRANLIQVAWAADNMGRVRQLLDEQRPRPGEPDLRGFEWHYYQRLTHADLRTLDLSTELLSGYGDTLLSPDGSRFAAVTPLDKEGTAFRVRVWELATGKEVFSARADIGTAGTARLAFSRDGKRLALAEVAMNFRQGSREMAPQAGRLSVWDCDTGKELCSFGDAPVGVALSADGRRVAAVFQQDRSALLPVGNGPASDPANGPPDKPVSFAQEVQVWDVDTRKEVGVIHDVKPEVVHLTFSPDGNELAAALFSPPARAAGHLLAQVRLWEVGGKELWTTVPPDSFPSTVQFSADGTRLVCSSVAGAVRNDRRYPYKLYDAASGKELLTFDANARALHCTFSPNCRLIATAVGPNVQVWDAAGEESQMLKGHPAAVTGVGFSADGSRLVSVDAAGVVKEWATPTLGAEAELFKIAPYVSPDGSICLKHPIRVGGPAGPQYPKVIEVFDRTGKPLYFFKEHTAGVQILWFSPDGRLVVTQDVSGKCLVWEAATGKKRLSLDNMLLPCFSVSGNRLAASQWRDGGFKVWDTNDFKERLSLPDRMMTLVLSPDGRRLLGRPRVGEGENPRLAHELELWDVDNARMIAKIPSRNLGPVAFDAAGKHVAVIDGTDISVWDALTGSQVATLRGDDAPSGIVLNADGTILAALPSGSPGRLPGLGIPFANVGPAREGIAIWDVAAGKIRYRLKGHTAKVWDVAFSPDGKRIASLANETFGDRVGEIKLWDTATGAELMELKPDVRLPQGNLHFNADGTRLAIKSLPGRPLVRFQYKLTWDATPLPEK